MIKSLHKWGIKSNLMYTAGICSVGLAFAAWGASNRIESSGIERADHWGLFVGERAPTFFAMGLALRMEEIREEAMEHDHGHHGGMHERDDAFAPASAMR